MVLSDLGREWAQGLHGGQAKVGGACRGTRTRLVGPRTGLQDMGGWGTLQGSRQTRAKGHWSCAGWGPDVGPASARGWGPETQACAGRVSRPQPVFQASGRAPTPTDTGTPAAGLDGLIFFQLPHAGLCFHGKKQNIWQ